MRNENMARHPLNDKHDFTGNAENDQPVYDSVVQALEAIEDPVHRVHMAMSALGNYVNLIEFNIWYRDLGLLSNAPGATDVYGILCESSYVRFYGGDRRVETEKRAEYVGSEAFTEIIRGADQYPILDLLGTGLTPESLMRNFAFQSIPAEFKPAVLTLYYKENAVKVLAAWTDAKYNGTRDTDPRIEIRKLLGAALSYTGGHYYGDHRSNRFGFGNREGESTVNIAAMDLGRAIQDQMYKDQQIASSPRGHLEDRLTVLMEESMSITKALKNK